MIKYYKEVLSQMEEVASADANWVNIAPPFDHNELGTISSEYSIEYDLLTDSLDIDERSRYERDDNLNFLLINTPVLNQDKNDRGPIYVTAPIGIFLLEDQRVLTISSLENPVLKRFEKGYIKFSEPLNQVSFTLKILEQTVIEFLRCLKKLNLRRNLIEQELYNSSRNRELQQLLRIQKSLVYFVNSISDNDLLNQKLRRVDFLGIRNDEGLIDLFEDIIIDNGQALEMANVHTNILSSTMEAYASIISNNMNVFIQRLTIITIILMVPTLVASFYGMNLDHLPLTSHPYAFYFIILFSILFGLAFIWFFIRRRSN